VLNYVACLWFDSVLSNAIILNNYNINSASTNVRILQTKRQTNQQTSKEACNDTHTHTQLIMPKGNDRRSRFFTNAMQALAKASAAAVPAEQEGLHLVDGVTLGSVVTLIINFACTKNG
jgi:hypothetical protein